MRLQDKVAVITGGASGIGLAATERFAKEGARVAMLDLQEEIGKQKAEELQAEGYRVTFYQVDVSKEDDVQRTINDIAEVNGTIDILINNAGITKDSMLHKMSGEAFKNVMDVNVNGVFYCTQAAVPYMVKQGKGKIINTSSVSGVYGNVGQTNYAASKAAVVGMTKTWAKELGGKGINVNAVVPGFTESTMVAAVPEKVIEKMVAMVPVKRLGKPEDIANAYLFLASEEADYINGTALHVDGGIMM
ncbi:3-oxoacyl-ACP reductase FabG [Alkalihalobacillus sp. CinArs1]|uniref:3-oxoacyl-ACP reductase FabG n=1 Tax=Alkalihalobacillus sp. CinArs1 TaxID=2995314 RepID=UPI0022DE93B4|nr:3-oxoacyl-ACP reductase FabG [Alkalihalobacillus sp. CinArs1]